MRGNPITLYRNGDKVTVQAIDAPAWVANGYSEDPDTKVSEKEIKALESGSREKSA